MERFHALPVCTNMASATNEELVGHHIFCHFRPFMRDTLIAGLPEGHQMGVSSFSNPFFNLKFQAIYHIWHLIIRRSQKVILDS